MEKTFSLVKKTGVVLNDTYAIRVDFDKEVMNQHPMMLATVSFDQGLLTGIHNSFKLRSSSPFSSFKVYYVVAENKESVFLKGMKLSFLADGASHESIEMKNDISSNNKFMFATGINDKNIPDSVNELKVEITISKAIPPKFEALKAPLPTLPGTQFTEISKFFLCPTLSDVSIKCGTETYPAHIFILSLHSHVFKTMFSTDTQEAKEKIVDIKEVESSILIEMLRFCYSEQVENLKEIGMKLYELADRYMIENLKTVCEICLTTQVTEGNAVQMYTFARKYEMQRLIEESKRILSRNRKTLVKNSTEFQNLLESVPVEIAFDILHLLS